MWILIGLVGGSVVRPARHLPPRAVAEGTFSSSEWKSLQVRLDKLPAFTCVDLEGTPLAYERDGEPLSIFFGGVERAQQELEMAKSKFPQLQLRLIACGLGDAYMRSQLGDALLVPAADALAAAGDAWNDDQFPLYTCLSLSTGGPAGPETPLFMCPKDASLWLDAATRKSSMGAAPLPTEQLQAMQVLCTSLDNIVEVCLAGREKEVCGDRFSMVPPSRSVAFLKEARRRDTSTIFPT